MYSDGDLTFDPPELPGPDEPFAVMGYDAVQAVWMLRRAQFIQIVEPDESRRTIWIREARVVKVAPKLYTIYINGDPLDWDRSYIRYSNRMQNLRLLFSYRNQPHPMEQPFHF